MLLRQMKEGVIAISQPAHAWLSGVMARSWGGGNFDAPAPFEEVCLAAAFHDNGWLDWETAPQRDPRTGWPLEFWHVPPVVHTAMWRTGVAHVATLSAYAAVLVSMHGETIYDRSFDPATAAPADAAAVARFREQQQTFQIRTVALLERDPLLAPHVTASRLRINKGLVAALDALSLHLCWGIEKPVSIEGVPAPDARETSLRLEPGANGAVTIGPWPFAGPALDLRVEGRLLRERFSNEETFALAFRQAPRVTVEIRLKPGQKLE